MVAPPLLDGSEKLIVADPFPAIADGLVGAPGTVAGIKGVSLEHPSSIKNNIKHFM